MILWRKLNKKVFLNDDLYSWRDKSFTVFTNSHVTSSKHVILLATAYLCCLSCSKVLSVHRGRNQWSNRAVQLLATLAALLVPAVGSAMLGRCWEWFCGHSSDSKQFTITILCQSDFFQIWDLCWRNDSYLQCNFKKLVKLSVVYIMRICLVFYDAQKVLYL